MPGAGHLFWYITNQPPKANSAFHPSGVGKWVPASAGKAKAGMVHSVSGWTRGVQVKLWNPLRTRAIPERLRGVFTTRRYTNPRLPYLTTPTTNITVIIAGASGYSSEGEVYSSPSGDAQNQLDQYDQDLQQVTPTPSATCAPRRPSSPRLGDARSSGSGCRLGVTTTSANTMTTNTATTTTVKPKVTLHY